MHQGDRGRLHLGLGCRGRRGWLNLENYSYRRHDNGWRQHLSTGRRRSYRMSHGPARINLSGGRKRSNSPLVRRIRDFQKRRYVEWKGRKRLRREMLRGREDETLRGRGVDSEFLRQRPGRCSRKVGQRRRFTLISRP